MGGSWTNVHLKRLTDKSSPRELHEAIWDRLSNEIHRVLRRKENQQVLADYLGSTAYDGFADDDWTSTETELTFSFSDAAGMCGMSCEASLHWVELLLAHDQVALNRLAEAMGWQLEPPEKSARRQLLEGRRFPLVTVKRNLYYVSTRAPGAPLEDEDGILWSDEGIARPRLAKLTPKERERVELAAHTGRCLCQLCETLRPSATLGEWTVGKEADVVAAWNLLEQGGEKLERACSPMMEWTDAQWEAAPRGPPALQVLGDWLGEQGAQPPLGLLVSMLFSRMRRR
jgi:hypothetical protein